MEFKFKVKRWCPNFKGKSLNFNTFLDHTKYSLKDLEYLVYQNYLIIFKVNNKQNILSNMLEYKAYLNKDLKKVIIKKEDEIKEDVLEIKEEMKPKNIKHKKRG